MDDYNNNNEKKGLFIPSRQISAYTALFFVLIGVVFIAGYFFGKKQVVDQFVARVEQESFADHIYSSMCALYDQGEKPTTELIQRESFSEDLTIAAEVEPEAVNIIERGETAFKELAKDVNHTQEQQFYAQLIGYGTQKAATHFAQKLQKKGICSFVKVRKSKSAQGKQTTWYQVVTAPFDDRKLLDQLTQQIAREEKIQGIRIVAC